MANKEWGLDCIKFYDNEGNCEEYTEKEYLHDLKRYLDEKKLGQEYFCNNPAECENCALYHENGEKGNRFHSCYRLAYSSFETIKKIFVWAQEHPVITNKDMLKKTFGKDVIHYIEARPYKEEWLDEEYKEPKGEKKNG